MGCPQQAGDAVEAKQPETTTGDGELNEKQLKKQAAKAEKEAKKAAREAELAEQQKAANIQVKDVMTDAWGYLPMVQSTYRTDRVWTSVKDTDESKIGQELWIRGRLQESRCKGSLGFLVLRNKAWTLQIVLNAESCPKEMVKWVGSLPLESVVDVYGKVTKPDFPISGATQQVELHCSKLHCVSKTLMDLPFQLKDANRREVDGEEEKDAEGLVRVGQDVRLDNRVLDLRTLAMQAILRVSHEVCRLFREYLTMEGFTEIHTPKLVGGTSEGGANVFRLQYFGRNACLAQSPQLYKQMAVSSDLDRVFEIGPVFRAENSNTHRHLCEFTGLDLEMAFKEHYFEVLEVAERLFGHIFEGLKERCQAEIQAVHRQFPAEPFLFDKAKPVVRLDFEEGVKLLQDANIRSKEPQHPLQDLSTEEEKALGKIVREKYNTDFYYMINYPLHVRPFYTMPNAADPEKTNSYDFFMRGEEILSGAQRIHDPALLSKRATECGIPIETIQDYINAFALGAYPHAGVGVGLERVVMLYLGLNNIRKSTMFPRDPKRLTP